MQSVEDVVERTRAATRNRPNEYRIFRSDFQTSSWIRMWTGNPVTHSPLSESCFMWSVKYTLHIHGFPSSYSLCSRHMVVGEMSQGRLKCDPIIITIYSTNKFIHCVPDNKLPTIMHEYQFTIRISGSWRYSFKIRCPKRSFNKRQDQQVFVLYRVSRE